MESVGKWIGDNLPGAIRVLSPLVTGLVDLGFGALKLAFDSIVIVWNTALGPAFDAIGKWVQDATGGWDNLARGAERLRDSFRDVAQIFMDFASGKVRLPDWLARALGFPASNTPAAQSGGGGGSWGSSGDTSGTPTKAPPTRTPSPAPSSPGPATKPSAPSTAPPPPRNRQVAGMLASGGTVQRGKRYVVGEEGPEIFEADRDGRIHPNSVYRAMQHPLAAQLAAWGDTTPGTGEAPASPGRLSTPAPRMISPSFSFVINNPVIDTEARLRQFRTDMVGEAVRQVTASINSTLLAEG